MNASTIATAIAALPCPFCGAKTLVRVCLSGEGWYVGCMNTRCFAQGEYKDTRDEAIAWWNRRTTLQPDSAAVGVDGLSPCPFHGEASYPPQLQIIYNDAPPDNVLRYVIYCFVCRGRGPVMDTEGEAVAAWNKRVAAAQPVSGWMPVEHELYEYPDGKRGLVYANADGMGRPQLRYFRDADTDTPTETVIILPEHLRLCKRVAAPQAQDEDDGKVDLTGYLRASASTFDFWDNDLDAECDAPQAQEDEV